MSTTPSREKLTPSDYARILPPLLGAIGVVAAGTGLVFTMRGLGFFRGFMTIVVASALMLLIMGGFAATGSYLDERFGKDVAYRLVGAGIGFVVLVVVLFNLAPVLLGPYATIR